MQPLFSSTTLPLLEKVAAFAERRHEVLAGNIANIDTPEYKTRDLPTEAFQEALRSAIVSRQQPRSPGIMSLADSTSTTSMQQPKSMDEFFPKSLFESVEARPAHLTFQDGGNRSVENEVMEMTKNAMMQNFAIELMNSQLNLLQAVISERA